MRSGRIGHAVIFGMFGALPVPAFAQSNPTFSGSSGIPPQIIPLYGRGGPTGSIEGDGGDTFFTSGGGDTGNATSSTGNSRVGGTASRSSTTGGDSGITVTGASDTRELQILGQQPYGSTAVSTSQELGVNPASVAGIANAESRFRDVPTANGTTSAASVWQFTRSTFVDVSNNNGLGYIAADYANPNAQAEVAPYYVQQIANTIEASTGQPATTLDVYGGWVFGPDAGTQIALAQNSVPLDSIVSATSLANNRMTGWTVGDFRQAMSTRLGAAANRTALTGPTI